MFKSCFLFSFLLFCVASPASAHPHSWIDYKTKIVLNDAGEIIALKEYWVFDEFYAQFALNDFDANNNKRLDKDELLILAKGNLKNLENFDYFTEIKNNNKAASFKPPIDISSYLVDDRIALEFTLSLVKPLDASKGNVSYRIYDSSYYVAMSHSKTRSILFEGSKAAGCSYELIKPKPDILKIKFATSLGTDKQAPDGLGNFFAQKVNITCK